MDKITLKTLPFATEQQVVDQGVRHMLTQMQVSERQGTCRYRGPGGLRCVGGDYIADDEYRTWMEDREWSTLVSEGMAPFAHCNLIQELQKIHDNQDKPELWVRELKKLCVTRGLQFNPPSPEG